MKSMISKSWKRWVWSFSLAIHVSHPKKSTSIFFYCPKSLLPYPIFLAAFDQKVQPPFPNPFSLFLFSSLFALTRQPSLSHQNKISLSKEEIKGLTLKFQLPSLWVTRTRTQTLKLSCTISRVFCFQVRDMRHVLLISIKNISKSIMH